MLGQSHQRLTDQTNKGAKAFATMRSNLLLFNFALAMGIKQIADFVVMAAKVDAMGRAFNTLSGGTENASIAMDKLQEATNGTMSRFDLFQQANNAMILGVSKNSDEMAEMFDIAQRLGHALGKDTRMSVESLITGIGRQSRMMLDNIGIIVKAEEAYEAYAEILGVSTDQLTDVQRKQAFLNATMVSAREKVTGLGEEIVDMQMRMERVSAAWQDAQVNLGHLSIGLLNLDVNLSKVAKTLDNYNTILEGNINTNKKWNDVIQGTLQAIILTNPKLLMMATMFGFNARELKLFNEELEISPTRVDGLAISAGEAIFPLTQLATLLKEINDQKFSGIELDKKTTKSNKLVEASISAMANEMARLVIEGESLLKIKPGKILGQMFLSALFSKGIGAVFGTMFPPAAPVAAAVLHSGGLIKDDGKVQRFATGGTVRGGDNVPILAQGGEFVMSRNAVDSVGIENLNRMNQGGGGGAITLNISAPLVDDTVVDSIIPAIREAIRRGEDIGIS